MADNSDEDKEELTNHNLLLCFLNENPESDLEDYETSSPALSRSATKIPNNHPLACLKGKIVFKNEFLGYPSQWRCKQIKKLNSVLVFILFTLSMDSKVWMTFGTWMN